MKYIQSFYQYPVTFSSIAKTIPARKAQGDMKNIAEVTERELEKLQNCEPRFRELVNQKKYRVLNHIPASYVPANEQINRANAEAERVKAENEALKAQLEKLTKAEKSEVEEEKTDEPKEENKKAAAEKKTSSASKNTKKK